MTQVTWNQLQTWLRSNPHRTQRLTAEKPDAVSSPQSDVEGWQKQPIRPATPLSAILLAQDSLQSVLPDSARPSQIRDETTDLQEKAVLHLKGRAWPVRRTAEGISGCGMEENKKSWTDLGWRALCVLRECQIVVLNEEKKEISFQPEDIRAWSSEVDTFCVDSECRFLQTHTTPQKILSSWLSNRETAGWTIHQHETDGTMEQLRELADKYHEDLSKKPNKSVLMKRIGRAQSISALLQMSQ